MSKVNGLKEETALAIVGIVAVTGLEVTNMIYGKLDGMVLSSVIGAIVFLVTRRHYKPETPAQKLASAS